MDAETSFGLGRELENWGGVEDLPAMRTHYRDAAEAGLVEAMGRLGLLCEGRTQAKLENRLPAEVQGDFVEAARWYRTAADRGDLYAAFWLGRLYAERLGDWAQAEPWYRQAADAGHDTARKRLAAGANGAAGRVAEDAYLMHMDKLRGGGRS
ncbi:sel1 repeat family protein [Streptomyces sp. SID13588]|uniref:tetratricopeptide repeat protein n=1 Tax=Streptomyces sp. SID13588 TaxID=2706051 RepID=UPI0013C6620C|nr:sel1 repeat family protein [Streptomyces sp. SID13588]NEA70386.1 sel1 repeat family protein [Streptomyces sp. SID13588]